MRFVFEIKINFCGFWRFDFWYGLWDKDKNNFPTVFFGFDMKKNTFEGFKTALEKKEVEKALKARLGR